MPLPEGPPNIATSVTADTTPAKVDNFVAVADSCPPVCATANGVFCARCAFVVIALLGCAALLWRRSGPLNPMQLGFLCSRPAFRAASVDYAPHLY